MYVTTAGARSLTHSTCRAGRRHPSVKKFLDPKTDKAGARRRVSCCGVPTTGRPWALWKDQVHLDHALETAGFLRPITTRRKTGEIRLGSRQGPPTRAHPRELTKMAAPAVPSVISRSGARGLAANMHPRLPSKKKKTANRPQQPETPLRTSIFRPARAEPPRATRKPEGTARRRWSTCGRLRLRPRPYDS